jgi:2-C-methyl-D-erythritol 4-phosphate cytidylyltransferase
MVASGIDAVILAAGRGTRMDSETSKVFLKLDDKPILSYSIEKFIAFDPIANIIIVIHRDDQDFLEELIAASKFDTQEIKIVLGGEQRQDSSLAGLKETTSPFVLIHDAARPLFPIGLLQCLFEKVQTSRAVIPTTPVVDSLRYVSATDEIGDDMDRGSIHQVQTPQCFERELILDSLIKATNRGECFTDDAAAVRAIHNISAIAIPGARSNLKITTESDLHIAEALLKIH